MRLVAVLAGMLFALVVAISAPAQTEVVFFRETKQKAEAGDAVEAFNLGRCYLEGYGVMADDSAAARWISKSASAGYAVAQFYLGVCYTEGKGVGRNYAEAFRLYSLAADAGMPEAYFNLFGSYELGHGVSQDSLKAKYFLTKAADSGQADACRILASWYEKGHGQVGADIRKHYDYTIRAAFLGDTVAQATVAFWRFWGVNSSRDFVEAYAFQNLVVASSTGANQATYALDEKVRPGIDPKQISEARKVLLMFESKMTREQVADGQKKTRELEAQIDEAARMFNERQAAFIKEQVRQLREKGLTRVQ
jgi:TPR repeat protein